MSLFNNRYFPFLQTACVKSVRSSSQPIWSQTENWMCIVNMSNEPVETVVQGSMWKQDLAAA